MVPRCAYPRRTVGRALILECQWTLPTGMAFPAVAVQGESWPVLALEEFNQPHPTPYARDSHARKTPPMATADHHDVILALLGRRPRCAEPLPVGPVKGVADTR